MRDHRLLSRRTFLLAPALLPLARVRGGNAGLHHFTFEHIVGTSLDVDLWAASQAAAECAAAALLTEIERLTSILDTRDPGSEISRVSSGSTRPHSSDLAAVVGAYDVWTKRTGGVLSITPLGPGTPLNVDALGKAYILDRAADVAVGAPGVTGALVNIGGDIVSRGRHSEISIADPRAWQDNAAPLTAVRLGDRAIATSGTYARGAHLVDARSGAVASPAAASVIAATAVEANALAIALCVMPAADGLLMVERTAGAEAIHIDNRGHIERSSGFAQFERPLMMRTQATTRWPAGYELNISLTLTAGGGGAGGDPFGRRGGRRGGAKRPYVAVWIEDEKGRLMRVLAFWAEKERYYSELSSFYSLLGRDERRLSTLARATRSAGEYHLVWDGLDDKQLPVPPGSYRIVVETNQEHGSYGKQSGVIVCKDKPAQVTLSATANFQPVTIDFGPRPGRA